MIDRQRKPVGLDAADGAETALVGQKLLVELQSDPVLLLQVCPLLGLLVRLWVRGFPSGSRFAHVGCFARLATWVLAKRPRRMIWKHTQLLAFLALRALHPSLIQDLLSLHRPSDPVPMTLNESYRLSSNPTSTCISLLGNRGNLPATTAA